MRHAEAHYQLIAKNREHIGRFLPFALDHTLEDTRSFIRESLIKFANGTNVKSRAIPERLGFTKEGVLRQVFKHPDRFADSVVYSLLAEEWGQ
ncbi:MAG: GNAT family N-acetyltransferase [Alicyclobacillus sp.]|nr:GNAT family N-acetyltransferase [Alicyclobacillus sp.]